MSYVVVVHGVGRRFSGLTNPRLLDPQHLWRPLKGKCCSIESARKLADEQPHHAAVRVFPSMEEVYDNLKPPFLPIGWFPATATSEEVEKMLVEGMKS